MVGERQGNSMGTAWERQGNGMGTAWERHGMCESAFTEHKGQTCKPLLAIRDSCTYYSAFIIDCGPRKFTRYSHSLLYGRLGGRIPVKTSISAPVHTSPGAHPASYTMGSGSFPWLKRPGRGVGHPHSPIKIQG
jgi:hypothetical protein